MLNSDQQKLVEEAIKLVPVCVAVFKRNMPCLREVARLCDLESAAYLACCRAARTYDPNRGVGISAYFSVAIKNGILREIQVELKSRSTSIYRVPLSDLDPRLTPHHDDDHGDLEILDTLSPEDRRLIEERLFKDTTLRSLGDEAGCHHRTVRRRVQKLLDRLRLYEEGQLPD